MADPDLETDRGTATQGNRGGWWQKYRLPIILAVVAVSFYIISLVSIIYGRGPVG